MADLIVPTAVLGFVDDVELRVVVSDGRTVTVPLARYPRLTHATPEERGNYRMTGLGGGIHWPDLDEDISVESLLRGWPSRESGESLRKWLATRD